MPRRLATLALVLAVLLGAHRSVRADDVPDEVKDLYTEALTMEASGDLKKAYSVLSRARQKDPLSVDFWELYVRVWRGLDKKEDILWDKIVGKVEKANPKSPVFELLRARLAETSGERLNHLRAAVAKAPDVVRPQLLLAKAVLANGDDIEAEEILDKLLEKNPGSEEALVTRGELDLDAGRTLSALSYAEEKLQEHDLPGLHDLRARALFDASATDESRLEEAEAAAKKAVEERADPPFVRTLVNILERRGDIEGAVKLLDEQYEKTHSAVLASKLGELAFRRGEYAKAIEGLGIDPEPSLAVLKALAVSHARLGNVEAMRRVEHRLQKRLTDDDALWIPRLELAADEFQAALAALEGQSGDGADFLRLTAYARLGDVEHAKSLAAERARKGGRWDEEYLVALLHAELLAKLGGKAGAARDLLRAEETAAAKADIASATVDENDPPMVTNSMAFAQRAVTYRRSLGGCWFSGASDQLNIDLGDGSSAPLVRVQAAADCPIERTRMFRFTTPGVDGNAGDPTVAAAKLLTQLLGAGNQQWQGAVAGFKKGTAALVDGAWADAGTAFASAVEAEPGWGRAKLFQAAAKALGGDAAGGATIAAEAVKLLPDDYGGQRLAVLLALLAGQDAKALAKDVAERQEAHRIRRIDAL